MPTDQTTPQRIAARELGRAPGEWINERRRAGLSFRSIADELSIITDTESFVSYETLRTWHTRWVEEQFVQRLETEVGGAA